MSDEATNAELERYRTFGEDWDTYGSRPISAVALAGAQRIAGVAEGIGLPPPQLSPVGGGGVQLEWWAPGDIELEIAVRHEGNVEILMCPESDDGSWIEDSASGPDDPLVATALHWYAVASESVVTTA